MSPRESPPIEIQDDLHPDVFLQLFRYPKREGAARRAVLLLHGASTSSKIFHYTRGGLVAYLREHFDVWTLDWRGSFRVIDRFVKNRANTRLDAEECRAFSLDRVVEFDIPQALHVIHANSSVEAVSLVGFCVGSGAVARAIESGATDRFDVDAAVLLTLGLFYQTPWDGWIKAADYLLEAALDGSPRSRVVDPRALDTWPPVVERAFSAWPKSWLGPRAVLQDNPILERTAFMYGYTLGPRPLAQDALQAIKEQYGSLHIGLYLQLGQMVRRGVVGNFDAAEQRGGETLLSRGAFRDRKVTLITGRENRIWHREGLDRMYEWLRRDPRCEVRKHALEKFGHLDLLWSADGRSEVYPRVLEGVCRA